MESKYTVNGIRYSSRKNADAARAQLGLKRCSKCGEVRSLDQFPADKSRADGLYRHCKPCLTEYRDVNREARRSAERARYWKNKGGGNGTMLSCPDAATLPAIQHHDPIRDSTKKVMGNLAPFQRVHAVP
jgi:hypothetical protein